MVTFTGIASEKDVYKRQPFIGGQSANTGLLVPILTLLDFFINRRLFYEP